MSKMAILIDGGYFLKRLPTVFKSAKPRDPESVARALRRLIASHLKFHNRIEKLPHERALLYRSFFYDAKPYLGREHRPISYDAINYASSDEAKFRKALHDKLRCMSRMAVRLGEVRRERGWIMREEVHKKLVSKDITVDDLTDDDFTPGLRQKAVDMRIGTDIASLTFKRQVDTIILVARDSDFVPASKLARREGVKVFLDPLWRCVPPELIEHFDGLRSGFPKPETAAAKQAEKDEGGETDSFRPDL